MKISQKKIRGIIEEYYKERNISGRIILETAVEKLSKEDYKKSEDGDLKDWVIEGYLEYLEDLCEHEEYVKDSDEEDRYNGQGDYLGSTKYYTKTCLYCGKSCCYNVVQTGDGDYDEEDGEWA